MTTYRQCGPHGLTMNQVMENTSMTQEAVYMPHAWAYAQQACRRCKDVNANRRIQPFVTSGGNDYPFQMRNQIGGLTYSSQYDLPYSFPNQYNPGIPGRVGEYYGILPPW